MKTPKVLWLAGSLVLLACTKESREGPPTPAASARATPQLSASGAASAAAPLPARPQPKRPYNVVLIMIEALRADMPWAGYPRNVAPWLNAFQAKHCVTYPRAYALASYTAKSVVPLLVGKYASEMPRDGYFFTKYPDPQNLFVTERLQQAGHRTLGGNAHGYFLPMMQTNQGFDDWRLIPGGVDLKEVKSVTGDKQLALAQEMLSDPKNVELGSKQRFFAYFHFMDPHHTWLKHAGHPDFGNAPRDRYDNEVHFTDALVGKLVDWAREQTWGQDTVFIFSGDHGEAFGEHGQFRHAYEVWEAVVNVPLMVCVPDVPPRKLEVRRSHIDLAPTVADLMGVAADPPFRGTSLVPEVFGETVPPRRIVIDLPRCDLMDRRRAVIADGYKIIGFGNDTNFKLYHLDRDPEEKQDLVEKEPEVFQRLKRIYEEESQKIPTVDVIGGVPLKGARPGQRW